MSNPKRELTDDEIAQVEALASCLNQEQIADYLGICRVTLWHILERDPAVNERYLRGKARAIQSVANGLLHQALNGDKIAAMFYLKTQAGWRETNRQEITGADGAPLNQRISVEFVDKAS